MDKYDKLRKVERNKALIEYARKYPDKSLRDIGRVFNVSRQRVWELLNEDKKNQTAEPDAAA